MKKCKIVVIDSGIDRNFAYFAQRSIEGEGLVNGSWIKDEIDDEIGHGTAVTYIIAREVPHAQIYILKLFREGEVTEPEDLIQALSKCLEEIKPDIIHLSNGMTSFDSYHDLEAIINKLVENNTVIVAAFDNGGQLSLPASFENVIGVDFSLECTKKNEYIYLKNNKVDFLGIGKTQRLPWKSGSYKNVKGASFAAPYITAEVAKIINATGDKQIDSIKSQIAQISKREKQFMVSKARHRMPYIERAIVFPFNKEIHSIARFENLLTFDVIGYYDDKVFGNVGQTIGDLIDCKTKDNMVQNYHEINWNGDFDAIILGHLGEMENLTKKEYQKYFVEKALEHGKKIVSFDPVDAESLKENRGTEVYTPCYSSENLEQTMGKMYEISSPVLGIYGTSSKQGKFSLQLNLREQLISRGYRVGQLGTEPSSLLFGMEEVFPIGYNSTVDLKNEEIILAINQLIRKIEDKKQPDIILFGMQSNTVPYNVGNIAFYNFFIPLIQLGALPDACILCVNTYDDVNYIKQTIKFIESYSDCKVISLVVSPVSQYLQTKEFYVEKFENNKNEQHKTKELLSKFTETPVFLLDDENEIQMLITEIERFFT
ncbi:S8 family serine peptidase [Paenibacillus sp.]|uniref:S8 family serine peptidase n=1 Tax=Paenibacillus sp. TaxID=58172 RepID=UPI0028A6AC9D|nr:S8 family serine peptidase [Paenibacillus sp.]